jgi:2TM domain-containing protein
MWIIYPILGLGLLIAIDAWKTFGEKPISESAL